MPQNQKTPAEVPVWTFHDLPLITDSLIDILRASMQKRLQQHPRGIFVSHHEMLGVITEEHHDLLEAVKSNNLDAVAEELADLTAACVAALASLNIIKAHKESKGEQHAH